MGFLGFLDGSDARRRRAKKAKKAQERGIRGAKNTLTDSLYGSSANRYSDSERQSHLEMAQRLQKQDDTPSYYRNLRGDRTLAKKGTSFQDYIDDLGYDPTNYDDSDKGILGDLESGYEFSTGAIGDAYGRSKDALISGRDQAIGRFSPYSKAGRGALSLYQKGLSEGFNIEDTPGFKLQADLANKQLNQRLAASGKGRSGVGIAQYAMPAYSNMLSNEYNNYFNRLNPIINYGYNADSNIANQYSNTGRGLAGLERAYGADQSSLRGSLDSNRAALEGRYADNMANLDIGQGAVGSNYQMAMANLERSPLDWAKDAASLYTTFGGA